MRKNLPSMFPEPTELAVARAVFSKIQFGGDGHKTLSTVLGEASIELQQLADVPPEVRNGLESYVADHRILERLQEASLIFHWGTFSEAALKGTTISDGRIFDRPPFYYEVIEQPDHSTRHVPYQIE